MNVGAALRIFVKHSVSRESVTWFSKMIVVALFDVSIRYKNPFLPPGTTIPSKYVFVASSSFVSVRTHVSTSGSTETTSSTSGLRMCDSGTPNSESPLSYITLHAPSVTL